MTWWARRADQQAIGPLVASLSAYSAGVVAYVVFATNRERALGRAGAGMPFCGRCTVGAAPAPGGKRQC